MSRFTARPSGFFSFRHWLACCLLVASCVMPLLSVAATSVSKKSPVFTCGYPYQNYHYTFNLTCSVSGKTLTCSDNVGDGYCFFYTPSVSVTSHLLTGSEIFTSISYSFPEWRGGQDICTTGGSILAPKKECWQVVTGDIFVLYTGQDADNDGIGDSADNCPGVANNNQLNNDGDAQGDACDTDDDNDGVPDVSDNCPLNANANQLDTDHDGQGNVCDSDDDNDGVPDYLDPEPLNPANGTTWPLSAIYKGSSVRESVSAP